MKKSLLLAGLSLVALGGLAYRLLPIAHPDEPAVKPAPLVIRAITEPAPLPVVVTGKSTEPVITALSAHQALYRKDLGYDARLRAINALGDHLGLAEQQVLLDYLKQTSPDDGLSLSDRHGLKNDLLNVLRSQTPRVENLISTLTELSRNSEETPVMRDYAIQHLSAYRDQITTQNPTQLKLIDDALWYAAAQTQTASAGTALLALTRIVEASSENASTKPATTSEQAYRTRAGALALAIAADKSAPVASRITALSVCSRLGEPKAAEVALAQLSDPRQVGLNLAIFAVLQNSQNSGWQPDAAARQRLQPYAERGNNLVRASAQKLLTGL